MSDASLDSTDRKILRHLQDNGRLSNVELAERVALSPSPCLRRVKQMEDDGVIEGYGTRINRKKVGLGLTAFVSLSCVHHTRQDLHATAAALSAMPEVVMLHIVSGPADFLIEVAVADLEAYEDWLTNRLLSLGLVDNVRSYFSIRATKTDGVLPIE